MGDLDRMGIDESGEPFDVTNAVLFKQMADTAALSLYDLIFALNEILEIDRCFAFHIDSEIFSVLDVIEPLDRSDHRFRRYASPVQASPAKIFFFHADCF